MKWWKVALFPVVMAALVHADVMTLASGKKIPGVFDGFSSRKFHFLERGGARLSEYPLNVTSITLDAPTTVSAVFSRKQYDAVEFSGFDHNTLRFQKDGNPVNESVLMLKELTVSRGAAGAGDVILQPAIMAPQTDKKREWTRSGKWREMEDETTAGIISHGEEVDVAAALRKGYVNIVHFHMPGALSSVREGNYIQALAKKPLNRLVVWKVVVSDFQAPVCASMEIKSLPQFWFYDARGRLVKKLTDRFTEGDIDAAIKSARIGKFP